MLLQSAHLHPWHRTLAAKHSQYSFRHLERLQLHFLDAPARGSNSSTSGRGKCGGGSGGAAEGGAVDVESHIGLPLLLE